jgi:hypothetical protein
MNEILNPIRSEILSNEYYFYAEYFEGIQLKSIAQYFENNIFKTKHLKNKQDVENLINHLIKIKIDDIHIYNVFEDKEYEIKVKFYIEEKKDEL